MNKRLEITDLKKFILRTLLLIAALIFLDVTIGSLLERNYFNLKGGILYESSYSIDSTSADVLVFGSSRANHHYVPEAFEKGLKMSFYNTGRDGISITYYSAVVAATLARYTPKKIIIDLSPHDLYSSDEGKLAPLLPYINNKSIYPYILLNSPFERIKIVSKMYRFNSLFTTILVHKFRPKFLNKGYDRLDQVMAPHALQFSRPGEVVQDKVYLLEKLISDIIKRNIQLSIVISPSFYSYSSTEPTVKILKELKKKYPTLSIFNYQNHSSFKNYKMFKDDFHLNHFGALQFSQDLVYKLSKL